MRYTPPATRGPVIPATQSHARVKGPSYSLPSSYTDPAPPSLYPAHPPYDRGSPPDTYLLDMHTKPGAHPPEALPLAMRAISMVFVLQVERLDVPFRILDPRILILEFSSRCLSCI